MFLHISSMAVYFYIIDEFDRKHWYMPDFKVNNQFIEIKGYHFFKSDGTMQNP